MEAGDEEVKEESDGAVTDGQHAVSDVGEEVWESHFNGSGDERNTGGAGGGGTGDGTVSDAEVKKHLG